MRHPRTTSTTNKKEIIDPNFAMNTTIVIHSLLLSFHIYKLFSLLALFMFIRRNPDNGTCSTNRIRSQRVLLKGTNKKANAVAIIHTVCEIHTTKIT